MKRIKKPSVLVVGELNIDLILDELQSPPVIGKEVLAKQMTYTLGSSSAIFASNLSSLSVDVSFLGKLGKDAFGSFIIEYLQDRGISVKHLKTDERLTTGITVILNKGQDRAMITYPGAMEYLSSKEVTNELLSQFTHVHVSSVFLQPELKKNITDVFIRAKKLGLTTSLDPQWDPSEQWALPLQKLLPNVDVFLPNETELIHLTNEKDYRQGARSLAKFCKWLVVKRGEQGAFLFDGKNEYESAAYKSPNIIDAIGAGDSFDAGFICQYLKGSAPEECLDFGNLVGAISTTGPGGTSAIQSCDDITKTGKQYLGYGS